MPLLYGDTLVAPTYLKNASNDVHRIDKEY